jgi:zinc protease
LFGLPPERLNSYADDVNAVTAEQVRAAADQYLDPARADLVVVGDANTFWNGLRQRRPTAERINIDQVNFDTETLHY